jgi:hypothetical protein
MLPPDKSNSTPPPENPPDHQAEDEDNVDNLIFNSKLILDADKFKHKESIDSVHFKYSIDITNAPKNRLQTYLTSDLLDELDKENVEDTPPLQEEQQKPNNTIPPQNKFDQIKQTQKKKKPFEIREGDWTCFDCHNLNFSFRILCNRCGLSKDISEQKCKEFQCSIYSNLIGQPYNNNNTHSEDIGYHANMKN